MKHGESETPHRSSATAESAWLVACHSAMLHNVNRLAPAFDVRWTTGQTQSNIALQPPMYIHLLPIYRKPPLPSLHKHT
jgi:hypothetical protein